MIAMECGHIRISLQTRAGREFVLQHVRGSAVIGEVVVDGSSRTADATVAAPTSGLVIERGRYMQLSAQHPELAQAAISPLCGLVRYTTDHIETIALHGLTARLARFLLAAAGEDETAFVLDLTQPEIADLIGSSRPKVNRALVALEKAKAIVRSGRTINCDRQRLASRCG